MAQAPQEIRPEQPSILGMTRAEIPTNHAKSTTEKLHAKLGGKIKDNKREARRLAQCMRHVEAVLKMLEPGYNVKTISIRRRKPNPWFKPGTIFRHALDVLRGAQEPLTAREVTNHMLAASKATASQQTIRGLAGVVQASLRAHTGKSVKIVGEGMPARWKLTNGHS
jgi:hypothetical protein